MTFPYSYPWTSSARVSSFVKYFIRSQLNLPCFNLGPFLHDGSSGDIRTSLFLSSCSLKFFFYEHWASQKKDTFKSNKKYVNKQTWHTLDLESSQREGRKGSQRIQIPSETLQWATGANSGLYHSPPHPRPAPTLLRYNWHTTLCKFKVYNNVLIWHTYVLQNNYHLHHVTYLPFLFHGENTKNPLWPGGLGWLSRGRCWLWIHVE